MKKFYIISIILLILIGLLGFGLNKKYRFIQTNEDAQRIYKQGLEDIKNNDLQNAYYNFARISRFNSYYEASLFRQGLIATELNDNESAIKAYETLLDKFPSTFFAQKSIYNVAIAYFNSNMQENAYANFKLITKKYSKSDYADASNYFLGVLTKENNKNEAINHFVNYINDAPNGKYSLLSVEELLKMPEELTQNEFLSIGKAYLSNNKYQEALEYLNKAEFKDAWGYISIAQKESGDYKNAKHTFEEGLSQFSQNGSEIQQQAIENYTKMFKNRILGLKEAKKLCDKSNCELNDYIMFNLIPSVDKQTKLAYYNRIYEEFPQGDFSAEALFNSIFNDYESGSYDNAIIKAKRHLSKYADKKSAPAVMYWMARSYDKKRNTIEANTYYNKIINKYSDTYYAYLSASKTNKIDNPYEIKVYFELPETFINIDFPILHTNMPITSTKKIDELIEVGDFNIFESADFDNDIVKSWVAYYEGDITKASVIAEKFLNKLDTKPNYDDDVYKLAYPIGYAKLINKYGKNSEIKPILLLSLIRKESRFNPYAISSVGARGLTQLMPETAKYIASLTNTKYDFDKLFDPEYNIDLGTKYYSYIKKNHHSQDVLTLASYNGGHGAVTKWLNSNGNTTPENFDEFVEKIPYPETKDYVKQIYKNYWVYLCIYKSSRVK